MLTFSLSGLWHGASWNYVLWGVYWGLLIVGQRLLTAAGLSRWLPWALKVACTFGVTCVGWLLFRERDLAQILHDLALSPFAAGAGDWQVARYLVALVMFYTLPLTVHLICTGLRPDWELTARWPVMLRFAAQIAICALLLLGIVTARSVATSDFIYFQF